MLRCSITLLETSSITHSARLDRAEEDHVSTIEMSGYAVLESHTGMRHLADALARLLRRRPHRDMDVDLLAHTDLMALQPELAKEIRALRRP